MQQGSNQLATKGDLGELRQDIKQDIKEIKDFMMQGFIALDQKIDNVEKNTNKRFEELEEKMDNRFDNLENKMEGFKTKVAW